MHVAELAECPQQLDLGDREAGVSEQREPRGQVEPVATGGQPGKRLDVPHVRRRGVDAVDHPAPQLRLPRQVAVEPAACTVCVATLAPVRHQRGSLHGVAGEQPGQPSGHGVATAAPQVALVAGDAVAQVRGQGRAPRLVEGLVDHLQQRPDQAVRVPGVVALLAEQQCDQGVRGQEPHAGAHPVSTARSGAQPVREPLGQPPLDTASRDDHDLLGERVVQRLCKQPAEPVGEQIGRIGAMQLKRHATSPTRLTGCYQTATYSRAPTVLPATIRTTASTACRADRPFSRHSERQVVKARAWETSARRVGVRCRFGHADSTTST